MATNWQQKSPWGQYNPYSPSQGNGCIATDYQVSGQMAPSFQNSGTTFVPEEESQTQAQAQYRLNGPVGHSSLAHKNFNHQLYPLENFRQQGSGFPTQEEALGTLSPQEYRHWLRTFFLGPARNFPSELDSSQYTPVSNTYAPNSRHGVPNKVHNADSFHSICELQSWPQQGSVPETNPVAPSNMATVQRPPLHLYTSEALPPSDFFVFPSYQKENTGLLSPGTETNVQMGNHASLGEYSYGTLASPASQQFDQFLRVPASGSAQPSLNPSNIFGSVQWDRINADTVSNRKPVARHGRTRRLSAEGKLHANAVRKHGGACVDCKRKKTKVRVLAIMDVFERS